MARWPSSDVFDRGGPSSQVTSTDPKVQRETGCVLVVEDNDDIRSGIRLALEDRGYAVLEARNGREALAAVFADDAPDVRLIISDLDMPEMSGAELVAVLSSYARLSLIPVIVISGSAASTKALRSRSVVTHLSKPFDMAQLMAFAVAAMAKRPG